MVDWNQAGRTIRRLPGEALRTALDYRQRAEEIPSDLYSQGYGFGRDVVGPAVGDFARGVMDMPPVQADPVALRIAKAQADMALAGQAGTTVAPPVAATPPVAMGREDMADEVSAPSYNPGRGMLSTYDTPQNPGSIRYSDPGGSQDNDAVMAGLRQRAMPQAPDFPDLNVPYTDPTGSSRSVYSANPLWALSQAGLAQDEAVRSERERRYGGMRDDALVAQQQELQRLDPQGLDLKRKLAAIDARKLYDSADAQAEGAALKDEAKYAGYNKLVDEEAANQLAELRAHPQYAVSTPQQRAAAEADIAEKAMQKKQLIRQIGVAGNFPPAGSGIQ